MRSPEDWESRLPEVPAPVANYVTFRRSGQLAFTSGVGPISEGKPTVQGKLGGAVSLEEGYGAARTAALLALSILNHHLGGLDRLAQALQMVVYVASTPDFTDQPKVADGATDLLVEVLGDRGKPTRAAVGVPVLPLDIPVELTLLVEAEA